MPSRHKARPIRVAWTPEADRHVPELACKWCGLKEPLGLPVDSAEFRAKVAAFFHAHRGCWIKKEADRG